MNETPAAAPLAAREQASTAPASQRRGVWRHARLPLLLLLALGALLLGAAVARPGAEVPMSDPAAGRYLVGFNERSETNASDTFRWSRGDAPTIFVYGVAGRPVQLTLRLSSARPPAAPPADTRLLSDGHELARFTVGEQWRDYQVLLPASARNERAVRLEPTTFVPGDGDDRMLGVALSSFAASAPQTGGWYLPGPTRLAFLLLLPLLVYALLSQWMPRRDWPGLAGYTAGLLLVGLAAAFPWQAGYWLPTLWPLLGLLAALALLPRLHRWSREQAAGGVLAARLARLPLLPGGLALGLVGLLLLRIQPGALSGWALPGGLLLALGTGALLLALARSAPATPAPRDNAPGANEAAITRTEMLLLAGITLLAGLLRLWQLDSLPMGLWRDEARHGLAGLRILSEPDYRPVYVPDTADLPALLFYLMTPFFDAFGPHVWTLRLVPALVGSVLPLAGWWALRPIFGRRVALLTAFLLACTAWAITMSRWAFPTILDPFFSALALGCMWRALPYGPPQPDGSCAPLPPTGSGAGWRAVLLLAASALCAGLGAYTYVTGRFVPLLIALLTLVRLGPVWARWRYYAPALAVACIVGLLVLAPLGAYILNNPTTYNQRVEGLVFWNANDRDAHAPATLLLRNAAAQLGLWHVQGDMNGRYLTPGIPVLEPLSGLLLLVGLGLIWQQRAGQNGRAVLAIWLLLGLLPGLLSAGAPHLMRSIGLLLPTLAAVAMGMLAVADRLRTQRVRLGWLALCCLVPLGFNSWLYFGSMPNDPRVYGQFYVADTRISQIARAVAETDDPTLGPVQVIVTDGVQTSDVGRFLAGDLPLGTYDDERSTVQRDLDQAALLLLPGHASAAEQAAAQTLLGPDAVALTGEPTYPAGGAIVHAFAAGDDAVRWWQRYGQQAAWQR